MNHQIIFGTTMIDNHPPRLKDVMWSFPGSARTGEVSFQMNEEQVSQHLLLLGGSGCGKTNVFQYILSTIRSGMTKDDVAIIFDTKGEFHEKFSHPGDYVIGNSAVFQKISHTWNIFDEILADGWDETHVVMNAQEMASALFHDRGSSTQPFFCNAAKDIFRGVLMHFVRSAQKDPVRWRPRLNNADLLRALRCFQVKDYIKIFNAYPDMKAFLSYFGDGSSNQALGVFGELNSMLSEYFVGILAQHKPDRSLSMRQAVRNRGARAIFVEYDLSVGETLTPVYRLLVDQALKEVLGRQKVAGKVYLIADEFKLLPKLQHIDDALNFGRGMGLSVVAGIQSIEQLYDIYGSNKGSVIASGFGSMFAFHVNDSTSREYISKRNGTNVVVYEYFDFQKNVPTPKERDGYVVEEWDQVRLKRGQAVITLGSNPPFLFYFKKFDER